MRRILMLCGSGLCLATALPAQASDTASGGHRHEAGMTHPAADSGFAALQRRGQTAMGVDQYKSAHRFDDLPDGGRIELQSDSADAAAIAAIRAHFRDIEASFRAGDFTTPFFVHAQEVPGTTVLQAGRDRIIYSRRELPRGAELRLRTTDPAVRQAIHDFMAFQRREHRAGGEH